MSNFINNIELGFTPSGMKHCSSHSHNEWEMLYYFKGNGILTIGDNKIMFYPGLIVCQPPNIPHSEDSDEIYQNMFFRIADFSPSEIKEPILIKDNADRDFGVLIKLASKLYFINKKENKAILEHLVGGMAELINLWLKKGEGEKTEVELIRNLILDNFNNPDFNLRQVLTKTGFCTDHFRRCFKKTTGATPNQYLTNMRVSHAYRLISGNSYAMCPLIKEIAFMSGFNDPLYFSRIYKKLNGESPTETIRKKGFIE